jgi:hypothetical protein
VARYGEGVDVSTLRCWRRKLIKHHDSVRPAFYGSHSRTTRCAGSTGGKKGRQSGAGTSAASHEYTVLLMLQHRQQSALRLPQLHVGKNVWCCVLCCCALMHVSVHAQHKRRSVRPRRPLGRDADLDYEVESDQDWEEEPEGESLSVRRRGRACLGVACIHHFLPALFSLQSFLLISCCFCTTIAVERPFLMHGVTLRRTPTSARGMHAPMHTRTPPGGRLCRRRRARW